jgi:hypothetical protein
MIWFLLYPLSLTTIKTVYPEPGHTALTMTAFIHSKASSSVWFGWGKVLSNQTKTQRLRQRNSTVFSPYFPISLHENIFHRVSHRRQLGLDFGRDRWVWPNILSLEASYPPSDFAFSWTQRWSFFRRNQERVFSYLMSASVRLFFRFVDQIE